LEKIFTHFPTIGNDFRTIFWKQKEQKGQQKSEDKILRQLRQFPAIFGRDNLDNLEQLFQCATPNRAAAIKEKAIESPAGRCYFPVAPQRLERGREA
jgi:hypothetical protein